MGYLKILTFNIINFLLISIYLQTHFSTQSLISHGRLWTALVITARANIFYVNEIANIL